MPENFRNFPLYTPPLRMNEKIQTSQAVPVPAPVVYAVNPTYSNIPQQPVYAQTYAQQPTQQSTVVYAQPSIVQPTYAQPGTYAQQAQNYNNANYNQIQQGGMVRVPPVNRWGDSICDCFSNLFPSCYCVCCVCYGMYLNAQS